MGETRDTMVVFIHSGKREIHAESYNAAAPCTPVVDAILISLRSPTSTTVIP